MWFEFITFDLYILGEASFGAASFLGSSWAPQPGYSKEASPTLSLILPEGIGQQEGKMEGRGKRSDSGQPQGLTRLGVGRGQGVSFMGQRLGPRAAEALGLLGGI